MSKHTKGPWGATCLNDSPKGCHCGYVFDAGDKTIAKVFHNDKRMPDFEHLEGEVTLEEKNANARLIAAAPQLLEALKQIDMESQGGFHRPAEEMVAIARAAIAAAEGRA